MTIEVEILGRRANTALFSPATIDELQSHNGHELAIAHLWDSGGMTVAIELECVDCDEIPVAFIRKGQTYEQESV